MKDEGIGIAGWLLADLVLVLAIVFLAFTPAALDDSDVAAATVDAPLVLDIGCVEAEQDGRWMPVRCEPVLDGGDVAEYGWEADGGREDSSPGGAYFEARFADVGAVRLTVANAAGAHSAEFLVRPAPTPTATPTTTPTATPAPADVPDCSQVRTDFRFAQIVLTGARLGAVTWDEIADSRVRVDVIKSEELKGLDVIGADEWWGSTAEDLAEEFLREKLGEELRIALVETFSHERGGSHVSLSTEINDVFHEGLRDQGISILREPPTDGRWQWFGDYLAPRALDPGEARLSLYFVKPFDDEDCR